MTSKKTRYIPKIVLNFNFDKSDIRHKELKEIIERYLEIEVRQKLVVISETFDLKETCRIDFNFTIDTYSYKNFASKIWIDIDVKSYDNYGRVIVPYQNLIDIADIMCKEDLIHTISFEFMTQLYKNIKQSKEVKQ